MGAESRCYVNADIGPAPFSLPSEGRKLGSGDVPLADGSFSQLAHEDPYSAGQVAEFRWDAERKKETKANPEKGGARLLKREMYPSPGQWSPFVQKTGRSNIVDPDYFRSHGRISVFTCTARLQSDPAPEQRM